MSRKPPCAHENIRPSLILLILAFQIWVDLHLFLARLLCFVVGLPVGLTYLLVFMFMFMYAVGSLNDLLVLA